MALGKPDSHSHMLKNKTGPQSYTINYTYICVCVCVCVCVYNGILFSHKKKKILPFATTWLDLEGIMLGEISQTEKDKYHMTSPTCVI